MMTIRYCPECGSIGEIQAPCLTCCPDASPHFLPEEIAKQAAIGFQLRLIFSELSRKFDKTKLLDLVRS